MGEFLKKNLVTVIILTGTLVLAGIAVFTAIRLYQLRSQPVAPNVPRSTPAAAAPVCTLNFTLATASPSPSPTPVTEFACVSKGAFKPNGDGTFGDTQPLTTVMPGDELFYRITYRNGGTTEVTGVVVTDVLSNKLEYVSSPTSSCAYTASNTTVTCTITDPIAPTQTGSVLIKVRVKAGSTGSIENSGIIIYEEDDEPLNCSITLNIGSSPTPTPSPTPTASPTVPGSTAPPSTAEPELPEAGISAPTLIGGVAGILLLIGAALLAF